jgi:hypothetical protein
MSHVCADCKKNVGVVLYMDGDTVCMPCGRTRVTCADCNRVSNELITQNGKLLCGSCARVVCAQCGRYSGDNDVFLLLADSTGRRRYLCSQCLSTPPEHATKRSRVDDFAKVYDILSELTDAIKELNARIAKLEEKK